MFNQSKLIIMKKLPFTHWRLYLLWATHQKKRFKIACQSFGLTREEIKNIITV